MDGTGCREARLCKNEWFKVSGVLGYQTAGCAALVRLWVSGCDGLGAGILLAAETDVVRTPVGVMCNAC